MSTHESNTAGDDGSKTRDAVHGSGTSGVGNWRPSGSWCGDNSSGGDCGRGNTGRHGSAAARASINGDGP